VPGTHEPRTDALLDPATYAGDLHAALARLRAEAPLAWNATKGFWAVSRHADVSEVSSDPSRFCSGQGILVDEIGVTYDSPPTMMHADPPQHTRYRKLARPGFTNAVVRGLEPMVRERTGLLLDALATAAQGGAVVDVTARLAVPLPIQLIASLLGLPEGDEERLFRWSEAAIPGATDWPEEERMGLLGEMTVELLGLAAQRRVEPRDDVVSMLAGYEEDGESLTDDELGMFLIQLLVAGNETTRNSISGALAALAEHPDQLERLAADPSLLPTAVADTTLAGTAIAAGDPLLLLYASANRDEAEYGPTADTFDVGRTPNHHVALGHGPHFCLGAALARLELTVVLEGVVARWRRLEVAGPIVRSGPSIIAGIRAAPQRLEPR
jgi:cytochrome P450